MESTNPKTGNRLGLVPGYNIVRSHYEGDVLVLDEVRLTEVSIVHYKPGDEKYGVHPIQRVVEPVDADQPLPEMETEFEPTDLELQRAVNSFNAAIPEFDGLLDADVTED